MGTRAGRPRQLERSKYIEATDLSAKKSGIMVKFVLRAMGDARCEYVYSSL